MAYHMAIAPDYAEARHGPEERVEGARLGAEEVPGRVVCCSGLRYLVVRAWLHGVHQVGELDGILDKENRHIVSNNVW